MLDFTKLTLEEKKSWYIDEVITELRILGYSLEDAKHILDVMKFKKTLDEFYEIQMHYMPEDAAAELVKYYKEKIAV